MNQILLSDHTRVCHFGSEKKALFLHLDPNKVSNSWLKHVLCNGAQNWKRRLQPYHRSKTNGVQVSPDSTWIVQQIYTQLAITAQW